MKRNSQNRNFTFAAASAAVLLASTTVHADRSRTVAQAIPADESNAAPACGSAVHGSPVINQVTYGSSCKSGITQDALFHYSPAGTSLTVGFATPNATNTRVEGRRSTPGRGVTGLNTTAAPTRGNATGVRGQSNSPFYCPADERAASRCNISGAFCYPSTEATDCPGAGDFCDTDQFLDCPSDGEVGVDVNPNGSVGVLGLSLAQYGGGGRFISNNLGRGWIDTEGFGVAGTGWQIGAVLGTIGTDCDLFQPFPMATAAYTVNNQVDPAAPAQTFFGLWVGTDEACLTGTYWDVLGPGMVGFTVPGGPTSLQKAGAESAMDGRVAMFATHSPEPLLSDNGQGRLVNGRAHIALDPQLARNLAVNEKHPLRVFVQLEGDSNGVYVTNKTATGFDVVELREGRSNVAFQYQVYGNRADEQHNDRTWRIQDLRFPAAPYRKPVQMGVDQQ